MNEVGVYQYTTTFYSVSPDNTGLILIVLGLGILFINFILSTGSCGGRDVCGKKWCIIGIVEDYYFIIWITGIIFLAAGFLWKWFNG